MPPLPVPACVRAAVLAAALAAGLAAALPAAASGPRAEADLVVAQRTVATFRTAYNGADPAARVARAQARIAEIEARELPLDFTEVDVSVHEAGAARATGVAIRAADVVVFTLVPGDLEEGSGTALRAAAAAARERLAEAIGARRAQRQPQVLAHGMAMALLATAAAGVALWLLLRGLAGLDRRLASPEDAGAAADAGRLAAHGRVLARRLVQVAALAFGLALVYAWLLAVLHEFPATRPLSQRLGDLLLDTLGGFAAATVASLPGLIAVALIALFAEGLARAARGAFRAVQGGRLAIPGVHPETAGATRRIVVFGIWALAIVAAYPHMPGSGSTVFQGVSVLIGAMITLGSTGIANQVMSGLTLIYSRALTRGDHVVVGAPGNEVEGVVVEVGTLATRVVTMRNQEATIPNAVVVANPIRNFSRQSGDDGTLTSARVTIGYDAPWRQVHALLEEAARRTAGVRQVPPPRVMQAALGDFHVTYELLVNIDRPLERLAIISRLHANVQDVFNEFGVQIMSPHFLGQPAVPVTVPRERWHAAPAPAADAAPR
ncbi:MAG: mechanosensitive ion channel [Burkholderiales bacterium]|nr:mechanosensitive ion channel [Burkholderiales bacterium]